jgi:hypothetical protein
VEQTNVYRIMIHGELPATWIDPLGGMQITSRHGKTVTLEGPLVDQAALAGVLNTLFELRLAVLEVTSVQDK